MSYSPDDLASRLEQEGDSTLAFFNRLAPEQWGQEVYPPGDQAPVAWRVRDVLAHFIAAEQGFHQLIANVAASGSGAYPGFDVDAYNQRTVAELNQVDPNVLLGQFAMVRERTVVLVRGLTAEQLERVGRHPAAGESTLSEIIRIIYNHNKLHLRDVRQALEPGGRRSGAAPRVQPEGRG